MANIKNILIGALILIAIYLYFFTLKPVETITVDKVVTKIDSFVVYVQQPPITIREEVTVHDTVYVSQDGDSINTQSAELDTVFQDSSELGIIYYINPSIFEVNYRPARTQIQTIKTLETIYVDSSSVPRWDRFKYGTVAGLLGTALLVSLVK